MKKAIPLLLIISFLYPIKGLNAQSNFTSSNLPIIIINTDGQSIPDAYKIEADLKIVTNGSGQMNMITGPFNGYNGKMGIETRGSTSQFFSPKKPFSIELWDDAGADKSASLLGMPKESDWILLAPYSDKSLLRDVLAFELARRFTALVYTPRTRLVEVVVNDIYQGIYVLIEKIKRDGDRVDVAKIAENDPSGGYIIKVDKDSGTSGEYWESHVPPPNVIANQKIRFLYHYPKINDITSVQRNYIQDFMYDMEESLRSNNFQDPVQGYQKYLNRPSFIDFALLNEVARNVDGYRISTYLFKDRDSAEVSQLHAGPAWDFNICFGNANYCDASYTSGWAWDFNSVCSDDYWSIPFWWQRLRQDSNYLIEMQGRWSQLRNTTLSDDEVNGIIDSLNNLITSNGAINRNFEQWPIMGTWQWPNNYVGSSHADEINYLRKWTIDRLHWMDGAMAQIYVGTYDLKEYFTPKVYPNPVPSGGSLKFDFYLKYGNEVYVRLIDIQGRTVANTSVSPGRNGRFHFEWELPTIAKGMYTYEITTFFRGAPPVLGKLLVY